MRSDRQPVPHAPVGEHHFKPERKVAGAAISEHRHAAGVGGEHPADLAASFRGEAQGEQAPRAGRHLLRLRQHEPRFDRHGVRGEIDVAHAVEPLERDHDLMAGLERDLPADQPGIAALRHDGRLRRVGEFQDRRDLSRLAGLEHESGLAAIAVAPFDEIARHVRLVANSVLLADDADERIDRVQARRRDVAGRVS